MMEWAWDVGLRLFLGMVRSLRRERDGAVQQDFKLGATCCEKNHVVRLSI